LMDKTRIQIMNAGLLEIDWTHKLNEYRNVFALSTEEFKKFAASQDEKAYHRIAQLAGSFAGSQTQRFNGNNKQNIESGIGKTELKPKVGDGSRREDRTQKGTGQVVTQSVNPYSKQLKVAEREKNYSNNDTSVNSYKQLAIDKQKEKLKEHKQENSNSKTQGTENSQSSTNKKKGKAKQVNAKTTQRKENNETLAGLLAHIAPKSAPVEPKKKGSNTEVAITIDNKND
ncbi:7153_t:CDS:2, partial [Gigaspora rosea]